MAPKIKGSAVLCSFYRFCGRIHSLAFFRFQKLSTFFVSIFQASTGPSTSSSMVSLILTLLPSSCIYKDSCDYHGPKQPRKTSHFKVLNQLCKDPFAFNTHNDKLWRSGYRYSWGSSRCLLQTAQCIIYTYSVIHLKSSYQNTAFIYL